MDDKLHDYIKRGMARGFSSANIKETLIKHGHKASDIEFAIAQISGKKIDRGEKKKEPNKKLIALSLIVILISVFVGYNMAMQQREKLQIDEESVQDYIDQIGDLTLNIEEKEGSIEAQLRELKTLNATVEEKEKVVEAQIVEIEKLFNEIKQEREEIKSLLLELVDSILRR